MRRDTDLSIRYPAYYRHDLMNRRREELGLSVIEVSQATGVKRESAQRVFLGTASGKKAYPIAEYLGMDWSQLHNFDLKESEFHLAVIANGRKVG